MGVSSFLIYIAWWQGQQFDALIEGGVKVGEEPEPLPDADGDGGDDTSCAVDDAGDDAKPAEKISV